MTKTKKNVVLTMLLLATIVFACCFCWFFNSKIAYARTVEADTDTAQPMGLTTSISVSIGSYSDRVWARAHNDFTLGFATVQVYVYLYSSLEYETDYTKMTLENTAYIADLNINKTLEVTAPIGGVKRYWKARVAFKMDNKSWQYKSTNTYSFDENGKPALYVGEV